MIVKPVKELHVRVILSYSGVIADGCHESILLPENDPTYINYGNKYPFAARAGMQRLIVISETDNGKGYGN